MLKTLQNAFRVKEVRQKLVYTFMMLIVFRIGSQMPIPGANTSFFDELFARYNNDAFGFSQFDHWRFPYEHVSVRIEHYSLHHILYYHAASDHCDSEAGGNAERW